MLTRRQLHTGTGALCQTDDVALIWALIPETLACWLTTLDLSWAA
jgi:hypothetical protein